MIISANGCKPLQCAFKSLLINRLQCDLWAYRAEKYFADKRLRRQDLALFPCISLSGGFFGTRNTTASSRFEPHFRASFAELGEVWRLPEIGGFAIRWNCFGL